MTEYKSRGQMYVKETYALLVNELLQNMLFSGGMLPSEDEDGDTESVNLRERCALCRLSRDSLLGQGQLVQCRSPNNHVIKKQKSKHGGDSIKSENCLEKSILTSNNNKPRWNNHIPDFDDGLFNKIFCF